MARLIVEASFEVDLSLIENVRQMPRLISHSNDIEPQTYNNDLPTLVKQRFLANQTSHVFDTAPESKPESKLQDNCLEQRDFDLLNIRISNDLPFLLLDVRDLSEYRRSHIVTGLICTIFTL